MNEAIRRTPAGPRPPGAAPRLLAAGAMLIAAASACSDFGDEPVPFSPPPLSPQLIQVVPDSGRVGDTLAVSGAEFGALQGTGELRVGGVPAPVLSWSDTLIAGLVPLGAPGGPVTVEARGRTSNALAFTVIASSEILLASLVPDSAAVGDTVSVIGSGFGAEQGDGEVRFGLLAAPVLSWSDTLLLAAVPAGAVSGEVRVLVGGDQSNPLPFQVGVAPLPLPVLAELFPGRTVTGDTVRIAGTQFGPVQAQRRVVFSGAGPALDGELEAAVVAWSDAEVAALVPSGAVSGPVAVADGAERSNELMFDVATSLVTYSQVDVVLSRPSYGCKGCHGGSGGFFCTTRSQILATGLHAPVVEARRSPDSYLLCKLRGTACGVRMPEGLPPVSAADIQVIADWIDQGLRP